MSWTLSVILKYGLGAIGERRPTPNATRTAVREERRDDSQSATVVDETGIELRGLRFHYRDWPSAKPGAPDLVLLHGYTGHARSWDAFAEGMTDRYRVLALDQRGHGQTGLGQPADKYTIDDMADDLRGLRQGALGLKDFCLLGLSMGGAVTIDYAGERPKALAAPA